MTRILIMIKKIILNILILCIALPVFAADPIKSLPFKEKIISKAKIRSICQKIKSKCNEQSAKIWSVKIAEAEKYYLIDESPQVTQLEYKNGVYSVIDQWSFKNYQHNYDNTDDELSRSGVYIYPALYPLNQQDYAIAVVDQWFAGYSGGGRNEYIADFIQLQPKQNFKVAIKNIPFYSLKSIRACFSDEDYKKYPHCHEEESTTLLIRYKNVGKKYYEWNLMFTEVFLPAHTQKKKIQKREDRVIPFSYKALQ